MGLGCTLVCSTNSDTVVNGVRRRRRNDVASVGADERESKDGILLYGALAARRADGSAGEIQKVRSCRRVYVAGDDVGGTELSE